MNKYSILLDNFLKDNLYDVKEITQEEYTQLKDEERSTKEINGVQVYFKITAVNPPEQELTQALQLIICSELIEMNKKQETMKGIIIFWFILTLINIGCVIYAVSKLV